ncbi:MAG: OB-fold nucleic acid binding domain-containing protein [Betaproteobacteria bacterium]|nr:OB-fold nucleic acid binding domain-containing protein [Betaproteobacteria bacterium]
MRRRTGAAVAAVLAPILLLVACTAAVPIKSILDNPREYADHTVTVQGKVTDVFSLVFVKWFTLNDGTASINVVTTRPLPAKGEQIRVTGTVKQAFSIGDEVLTVIVEKTPPPSSPPGSSPAS